MKKRRFLSVSFSQAFGAHRHVSSKFQPNVLAAKTHGIPEEDTVEEGMINSIEKGKLGKFPRKRESEWGADV